MEAHEFDKKLPALILEYAAFTEGLKSSVTAARIGATILKNASGKPAPQWPYDQVYMCINGVFYMNYRLKYPQLEPYMEHATEEYYEAEQLCAVLAWEKLRSIYHVEKTQWDESQLDVPATAFAHMPQWAMCINITNQDMIWDDKKPYGIIFHRSFGIMTPENSDAADSAVDGEPAGAPNNLSSVIILEDGTFVQGPFVDLTFKGTVNEFLEQFTKGIIIECSDAESCSDKDKAIVIENLQSYDKMARRALCIYLHLLNNMGSLVDASGKSVKAPGNPQPTKTKKGMRLFGADHTFCAWVK